MARSNTGSTSNWLSNASAAVSALPATFACWYNPSNLTTNNNLIVVGNTTGSGGDYLALVYDGANAYELGDNVVLADASSTAVAVSSTGGTAGTWMHCAAVFASSTSRTAYMNGTPGTANTTARTWNAPTLTHLGAYRPGGTTFSPLNGSIAEAAVWSVALTAAEITALANGLSPLKIRPASLAAYWPLNGYHSPELSIRGAFPLTINGTMAKADHCRVFYPTGMRSGLEIAAAPVGGNRRRRVLLAGAA